jgi:hypothetical protein
VVEAELQKQEVAPLEKLRVNLTSGRGGDPAELPLAYLAACTLDWSEDRLLRKGIFGQVFRGVDDARGVRFVVKRIDLASLAKVSEDPSRLGRWMWKREVAALTRFSNPHIVQLVGFTPPTVDIKDICLVHSPLHSLICFAPFCAFRRSIALRVDPPPLLPLLHPHPHTCSVRCTSSARRER